MRVECQVGTKGGELPQEEYDCSPSRGATPPMDTPYTPRYREYMGRYGEVLEVIGRYGKI